MAKTHFPRSGGNQYVQSFYAPNDPIGNVLYVNSSTTYGSSTGPGFSPEAAYSTLQAAHDAATADNHDHIFIAPGHAETISAAGGIAFTKSGLTVVGLGQGSNRPTFTWSATDATWTIATGGNTTIRNILTNVSIDEVVSMLSITAANVTLDAVDFRLKTAATEAIQWLLTTSGATDLVVKNCRHHQVTASASNAKWLVPLGARTVIDNNIMHIGLTSNAASQVIANSAAAVDLTFTNNLIGGLLGVLAVPVSFHASSTGIANNNRVFSARTTLAGSIALGGLYGAENYAAHVANKNGLLDPVVDA